MRNVRTFLLIILAVCTGTAAEQKIPTIVSAQWLAEHRTDKDLIVLQTGWSRNEYRYAHLPGAKFLWIEWLAPSTPDLSTEMPSSEKAQEILQTLGVTPTSRIVLVFTRANLSTTTRMLLAFEYFGFGGRVALLDGGLESWKAKGYELTQETSFSDASDIALSIQNECIVSADWIANRLKDPSVKIVDARTKNFFDGNGGGIARTGHLPGAVSMPYTTVVDSTNAFLSSDSLRSLFFAAGIGKSDTVVTYCHVGQQATVIWTAAKIAGLNAKVYDGSFEEWNMLGERYPVEK